MITPRVFLAMVLAAFLWSAAHAQFSGGGGGVTQTQVDSSIAAAQNSMLGTIVPPTDTLNGAVGSSTRLMREDAPRPTISQRTAVTTDASGNFSVTWAKNFNSATPAIFVTPLLASASAPVSCTVLTRSASGLTGKCWQEATSFVALLSLTISLAPVNFVSSSVMVIGLEPSQ